MDTTTTSPIRERREKLGLSRFELARLAGCSLTYLQSIERGCAPKLSAVVPRIENALTAIENGDEVF